MSFNEAAIEGLRAAVRLSPENMPLRQALGDALMGMGRYEEAQTEYKVALGLSPDNAKLKLALATAFYQDGKNSPALVIVEDMIKRSDAPAGVLVLHAKLLVRAGDIERAVRLYKRAIDADSSVADSTLAAQLGIQSGQNEGQPGQRWENSEAVDGKLRAARDVSSAG